MGEIRRSGPEKTSTAQVRSDLKKSHVRMHLTVVQCCWVWPGNHIRDWLHAMDFIQVTGVVKEEGFKYN